jgi:hypothetical protein
VRRRHFSKKLSKAQKAVVPSMMDAAVAAEARTVEECEQRLAEEAKSR